MEGEAGGRAEAEAGGGGGGGPCAHRGSESGGRPRLGARRLEADSAWEEQWFFNEPCELVRRGGVAKGWLHLSAHSLFFEPDAAAASAAASATPRATPPPLPPRPSPRARRRRAATARRAGRRSGRWPT